MIDQGSLLYSLRTLTASELKPHLGKSGTPFMYIITRLSLKSYKNHIEGVGHRMIPNGISYNAFIDN